MVLYKSVNCVGRSRNSADWTSRPNFGPACLAGLPDEWIAVLKTAFEEIDGEEMADLKPRTPQRKLKRAGPAGPILLRCDGLGGGGQICFA